MTDPEEPDQAAADHAGPDPSAGLEEEAAPEGATATAGAGAATAGQEDGPESEAAPGEGAGAEGEAALEEESRASRRRGRQPSYRVRRRRRVLATVLGVVVVLVVAFALWYELESHALGSAGQAEIVHVSSGESVGSVASELSAKKVIGSTMAFRLYGVVHGSPSLTPGDYLLHQNSTFAQVHAVLNAPPNVQALTVVPGFTLHEIATRVGELSGYDSTSFLQVASSGAVHSIFSPAGSNNLEGLVGTGTYDVLPGESTTALLTDMVQRFDSQATAAGLTTKSAAALGTTPYQVIIAASVVEKEGYIAKNMPQVARVIYNRLANDLPLQMDSTVLYSLGQDGGPVTAHDRQIQSPYNSYLNKGLPPTPICSPSPTALAAAVHPPPGAWLYFELVQKDGTEAFSDTFAEQLANEKLAASRGIG